ncbi:hypothetical protein [Salinibacillus xinjiangensis]|uniref:hypothetical protein n=1 Tax=Salinibacillus xinjiangensis TaxID=1229268 RepID=UPI001E41C7C9|nr:hypothetical protein [Salinibacillus xinjiangensis]
MYTNIFDEITTILHHDYAGCMDKMGWDDPASFRSEILSMEKQDNMTDERFVDIIQDYLLDFKDLHMSFKLVQGQQQIMKDVGFSVRRYGDILYVVEHNQEQKVKPGYKIVALDGVDIAELVQSNKRQLMESKAEREDWGPILLQYDRADIIDESGSAFTLKLQKYEKSPHEPEYG